jgi:predicted amidohydrolase
MNKNSSKNFFRGNVKVSVCTLNQWAMDFTGNESRIISSIEKAKDEGGKIILLPELCTSGYSCQDHFYENDTYVLSMDAIKNICYHPLLSKDVIIVIGSPVLHKGVRYNTMIFISNNKIILIRPKISLADDGNYREARWFNAWRRDYNLEEFDLNFKDQKKCPIGVAIVNYKGVKIAAEVCEELWTPQSMNVPLYLNDTDIILNSSGSHFESNKIIKRIKLLEAATKRSGGAYIYSNLVGCDGERLFFDGGSLIALNGKVISEEERFRLVNYSILTRNISLDEIRAYRLKGASIQLQSSDVEEIHVINIEQNINGEINNFINYDNENNRNECISKKIFNKNRNNQFIETLHEKYGNYLHKLEVELIEKIGSSNIPRKINKSIQNMNEKELNIAKYHEKLRNLEEKFNSAIENFNDIKDYEIEEIVDAASCWLWDYLRRSGGAGFMLPLSGGADSSSVALIVYKMSENEEEIVEIKKYKDWMESDSDEN